MKRQEIIFVLCVVIFGIFDSSGATVKIVSDTDKVNIMRKSAEFMIEPQDTVRMIQTDLRITNRDSINCLIVFERDTLLTDEEVIYKRFIRRDGDMPLLQWLLDGNVNWEMWNDSLFGYFFKILAPDRSFDIVFIKASNSPSFADPEKYVRIIPLSSLSRWKAMRLISPDDYPAFQPDIIAIPIVDLIENKGEAR